MRHVCPQCLGRGVYDPSLKAGSERFAAHPCGVFTGQERTCETCWGQGYVYQYVTGEGEQRMLSPAELF